MMRKIARMPLRQMRGTLLVLLLFVFLAFRSPGLSPSPLAWLQLAGFLMIGLSIFIRTLSSVYLAGYKNHQLVTRGPYSLSRNPLYVGWLAGAFGAGLAVGSPVLAIVLTAAVFLIHDKAILREEKRLSAEFPQAWQEYAASTPRWLGTSFGSNWRLANPVNPGPVSYAFLEGTSLLLVYALHRFFTAMQDASMLPVILYYF